VPQALRRVTPAADVAGPTRLLRPWAQRSPRAVLVLSGTQRVRGRVLSAVGHGHHALGWSPRFVPCCQRRALEARRRH
jgi:hypothetical protein